MDGSVSCRREIVAAGTSNASTTMSGPVAEAFCRPVTSNVKVWRALDKPVASSMGTRISTVFEYVSTSVRKAPSRDMRAMPVLAARPPIHVTDGPVKVNVACAPVVVENAAAPPLHDRLPSGVQPAVYETDGSVSSKRFAPGGGGGGGGALLATVTVTGAEVARLPAASRATAVRVCEPLLVVVVSKAIEYGAVVSSTPLLTPSSWSCTPATPTLSEALAVTVTVPDIVAPFAGEVMLTVGGVVSGGGGGGPLATVTVTGAEVARLPAASRAIAVMV